MSSDFPVLACKLLWFCLHTSLANYITQVHNITSVRGPRFSGCYESAWKFQQFQFFWGEFIWRFLALEPCPTILNCYLHVVTMSLVVWKTWGRFRNRFAAAKWIEPEAFDPGVEGHLLFWKQVAHLGKLLMPAISSGSLRTNEVQFVFESVICPGLVWKVFLSWASYPRSWSPTTHSCLLVRWDISMFPKPSLRMPKSD